MKKIFKSRGQATADLSGKEFEVYRAGLKPHAKCKGEEIAYTFPKLKIDRDTLSKLKIGGTHWVIQNNQQRSPSVGIRRIK